MDIIKKIVKVENQAKNFGFYWPNTDVIMDQIHSECQEIDELLKDKNSSPERLQEEIGDLLHAAFSLSVYCGHDPENTLEEALAKFEKRFIQTKNLAQEAGHKNLHGKNMKEMMAYWDKAKKQVG